MNKFKRMGFKNINLIKAVKVAIAVLAEMKPLFK